MKVVILGKDRLPHEYYVRQKDIKGNFITIDGQKYIFDKDAVLINTSFLDRIRKHRTIIYYVEGNAEPVYLKDTKIDSEELGKNFDLAALSVATLLRRKENIFFIFTIILTIIAICISVYLAMKVGNLQNAINNLNAQIQEMKNALIQLAEQLRKLIGEV